MKSIQLDIYMRELILREFKKFYQITERKVSVSTETHDHCCHNKNKKSAFISLRRVTSEFIEMQGLQ